MEKNLAETVDGEDKENSIKPVNPILDTGETSTKVDTMFSGLKTQNLHLII